MSDKMERNELSNREVVERGRLAFGTGKSESISYRKEQLKNFIRMIEDCHEEIVSAINKDIRKSREEVEMFEIEVLLSEGRNMLRNLDDYVGHKKLPFNALGFMDTAYTKREPYGVVLILGAWNYPFLLTLQPMIGAIGAGNAVILKPSECAQASALVMHRRIPEYLDPDFYQVICGGVERTIDLLTHKFDYIMFTGSTSVGRSVYEAAAKHLTPVTLELGGKSPVYIDDSADIEVAAKRVIWAKLTNSGQTCIAPDYLICSKKVETRFIETAKNVIREFFGSNPQESKAYTRIVNSRNLERIAKALSSTNGKILFGGKIDKDDLYIEPTLVADVNSDDSLMKDELFGPILPIITANNPDEAIRFIKKREKPLSLYIFSNKDDVINKIITKVSSGGVCINDCMWQAAWQGLPFGGVGESGIGRYHGKYNFETFSHEKSILHRSLNGMSEKLGECRYPPYSPNGIKLIKFMTRYFTQFYITNKAVFIASNIFMLLLGAFIVFIIYQFK